MGLGADSREPRASWQASMFVLDRRWDEVMEAGLDLTHGSVLASLKYYAEPAGDDNRPHT